LFYGQDYGSDEKSEQFLTQAVVTAETDLSSLSLNFSFEEVAEVFDRVFLDRSG